MKATDIPSRVLATAEAQRLAQRLEAVHGPILFHQSGGCCDGSAPMCYPQAEFRVGGSDILLGHVAGNIPVWIGEPQFTYWRYSEITLDVAPGRAAGMSLEGSEGVRFIVHSRLFSDDEVARIEAAGEPPRGDSWQP